jgi:tetratricopeptide (TPR) repeat protein
VTLRERGDTSLTLSYKIKLKNKTINVAAVIIMYVKGRQKLLVSEGIELEWTLIEEYVKYDKSVAEINRILAGIDYDILQNPGKVPLYLERIKAYTALDRYDDALNDASMIITLDPSAEHYMRRGNLYFDAFFSQNMRCAPNHDLLLQNALQDMTRAIKINPETGDFYYRLGKVYTHLEEYEQAVINMTKAIELDPQIADAYGLRGLAYIQLNQFQKALEDANAAIMIDPNDASFFVWRGSAYARLKKNEQAVYDFTAAMQIDPDVTNSYILRGMVYCNMGKYQEALDDITEYMKRRPTVEAYFGMAVVYQGLADQETDWEKRAEYQKEAVKNYAIMEQMKADSKGSN